MDIKEFDILNGDGVRVSLWVSGCEFHCKGCHNSESWDRFNGEIFDREAEDLIYSFIDKGLEKNLSILGGEPLTPYNRKYILGICMRFKKRYPHKNIWLWTGYEIEEVREHSPHILKYLDVIVCGKYKENLKCDSKYFGSSNQKLIKL